MPCFLSHQLFLRKSALLQSGKMIYVVRKGWKTVTKLHFCSFILFILLLQLELFCSYLTVAPYAPMRIRLAQLIIIIIIIIIMLKNHPCHPKKQNKRTQTVRTTKTFAGEGLSSCKWKSIFICAVVSMLTAHVA